MILKASQRGSGQNLAVHLMRLDDNEHMSLHDLRGFASDNLKDAFREAEAISKGTKCSQYLFSLSLSPPADARVPVSAFMDAIATIEQRLGLEDQPRAVVFHEKDGRRHAHAVWSRIDADTMKAVKMSFFKTKLMDVSRDLYLEHGWKMPRGMLDSAQRNPTNFTLAEWQQAKRQNVDPRLLKQMVQACWSRSDNQQSLVRSLEERGFFLAKGDKRGFVVLDHTGEIYALPRMLDLKTKDVRDRLGDGANLPSVEATRKSVAARMTPAIRRHIDESKQQFQARSGKLGAYKAEMTQLHRASRVKLEQSQKLEWDEENRQRQSRLPRGLRGIWHRITGKYQEVRRANEAEAKATLDRQALARQQLIEKQLEQRAVLQTQFKDLRRQQAEQLLELRRDVGRYLKFTRSDQPAQAREVSLGLRLER
ncbi:relaxase/mobilization nuclease domain-containing protein [Devosia sp. SL43]|uniref:relaxase/mobilization nuclease domain-containing protein n=1 Tax=Devosia sp. SL43 TaxID=2806348 RepID=UPI001F15B109|nr:relaxase/mobilization nuclease domain-containing protein [Devosia sp. SL43]UJW86901.1 relaxase/mobilization nuclease domain-containing protein [Devosia sp. SL43]